MSTGGQARRHVGLAVHAAQLYGWSPLKVYTGKLTQPATVRYCSASTVLPPIVVVVRVPAHGTGVPLADISHQIPCQGGSSGPGSNQPSPVTWPGAWSNRYSGCPA